MLNRVIITVDIPLTENEEEIPDNLLVNVKESFKLLEGQLKVFFPKASMIIEGVEEDGQKTIEG